MPKPVKNQLSRATFKASRRPHVSSALKYSSNEQSRAYRAPNKLKRSGSVLSPIEIRLSKVLHHETMGDLFTIIGATIGRASGIFGAALAFLLANLFVPIIYHYFGYEYTYFVSIASLIVGFVLGVLAELVFVRLRKS